MAFCTQSDLEIALGGADVLVQLADFDKDDIADAAVVTDYLDSGAAEIRTAVEVKHDPEVIADLDADSLRRLRDANASLSARIGWEKGSRGRAMPGYIAERASRAETFLDQLARGERRLGRVSGGTPAAINQPAKLIDHDPLGQGVSIAGFKRGFR